MSLSMFGLEPVREGPVSLCSAELMRSRAGVNNHSNFAYRPIDRLRTTMSYVYTMAFGTPSEKRTIIGMVHRAHAPVEGVSDADAKVGEVQYNANDPELQLWVAATLYAAGVDIYEKVRSFLNSPFQPSFPSPFADCSRSMANSTKQPRSKFTGSIRYWL